MTLEQRLAQKIEKRGPDECWDWTGGKNSWGYGYISVDSKMRRAHKIVWEMKNGPVPVGLDLDHLCRNRACCNPTHLEPVTRAENLRRGKRTTNGNENKTHCPSGHEYTEANTYRNGSGRQCRECMRLRSRSEEKRAYDRARYAANKQ